MKLYATITSERGKEIGKGGNDYLEINIKAEKVEGIPTRANIYRLRLDVVDGRLYATLHDYSNGTTQDLITFRPAPRCNHNAINERGLCVECGYNTLHLTNKELKGKKEKGKKAIFEEMSEN